MTPSVFPGASSPGASRPSNDPSSEPGVASEPATPIVSTTSPSPVEAGQAITIQLPPRPLEQWWEIQGVAPSMAAIIAVVVTAVSLHINTTRNLKASRETTDRQLEHARQQAHEDRAHAAAQAKAERDNSAEERRLDRVTNARKEIYTSLIDEYLKVQDLIAGLPRLDMLANPDFSQPLASMGASVNKLWIWGEVETVRKVREFHTKVSELFHEALELSRPLQVLQRSIGRKQERRRQLEGRAEALDQSVRQMRLESPHPIAEETMQKIAAMHAEHKGTHQKIIGLFEEEAKELQMVEDGTRNYLEFVVQHQVALMTEIHEMMSSARSEVGLSGDASILEYQSQKIAERLGRTMKAAGKNASA